MKKKLLLTCFITFFLIFSTLPLSSGVNINKSVKTENNSIELVFNPTEYEFETEFTQIGEFATITLKNEVFRYEEGKAKLPIIRRMIEIPQNAEPEIVLNSASWEYTSLGGLSLPNMIIPAQMSTEKIPEPQTEFLFDEEYYSTNFFVPEKIANVIETAHIRGRHFALIEISPIQYNPATGELKLMSSCMVTINLPNSDMSQTYEKIQRYSTPRYEKFFEVVFDNYGFYEEGLNLRNSEGYLIIVYDGFYDEIQPLSNLKQTQGFDVTVTKTSDIPGGPTTTNIYNYIEDAYDNWATPPAYVLLVGDTPQIPTFTGTSSYSEADLYFVTVDGSDYLPDIYIGRFPGSTESHIVSMVDKTVYYETGNFPSDEWIKKAAFIASSDAGQLAEQTHNYVIDNYLNPNGYTCDKIYQASGGSTADITNALNDGRSLCIYSGHGYSGGWACVPYDQSDVSGLLNENMYPFVCSHACSTNPFGNTECFGETWVREPDKAALAFWGASASTYWDEDDILEKGMFQAWWEDGLEWIGGMTDMGLYYVYENYSGGGMSKYYFEAYNVNGDPSAVIWSDNPNPSPTIPAKPNGPTQGCIFQELTFTTYASDPEGEQLYYMWDWGNGETSDWFGPYNSGETVEASNAWDAVGVYDIRVKAKDINGGESDWSDTHTVTIIDDEPPSAPTIDAPVFGGVGKPYTITISAADPELDEVYFLILWGDDTSEDWIGPYKSGEDVEVTHTYSETGSYNIIGKARDEYGVEGDQTQVTVRILKNRAITNPFLFRILEKILNLFNFFN